MLGQPVSMLVPQVVGFKLTGTLPRRGDGHRPGADRHPDAAEEGRRRQVRRVLRRRPGRLAAGRPGDDRQHGPRVRRDLRVCSRSTPRRSATSSSRAGRAGRSSLVEAYAKAQGMFHTAGSPEAEYSDTLELDLVDGRAEPGRPAAAPGPGAAARRQVVVRRRRSRSCRRPGPPRRRRAGASLPVVERFASEGGGTAIGVAEPDRRRTHRCPRRSPTARS